MSPADCASQRHPREISVISERIARIDITYIIDSQQTALQQLTCSPVETRDGVIGGACRAGDVALVKGRGIAVKAAGQNVAEAPHQAWTVTR